MADTRRIVVIGGGVIGLGVAYHLGRLGVEDVLLLERNQLTSGTSWHAAGIVGPLRANLNLTRIASYACELFPALEAETGQSIGFRQTGGYWLARTEDRLHELRRMAAMGDIAGLDVALLTPYELGAREPYLRTDDLAGALRVEQDAQANPVDICMAYAKGARRMGIEIRENISCVRIETAKGAVRGVGLSDGGFVSCEKIVNCAGAWACEIGRQVGVPIPLQAVEHMYVVTEAMPHLPNPLPVVRDLDAGIYIKGDTGKLVLGGVERDAKVWDPAGEDGEQPYLVFPEDWDQFEPFIEAGLNRVPTLAEAGIQHFMNGPESFTPDSRPLLGESPYLRGFFVAAGMNTTGMMSSAGVGKVMAEWITAGEPPMDLWDIDIARFGHRDSKPDYLAARMREAVADTFDMHWPHKQPTAGRNLRRLPLHDDLAKAGAVFGVPTGWERPLWYARGEEERTQRYSYGDQPWWPMAEHEVSVLQNGVALLELTPFSKFDVTGPGALPLLQAVCANDVDMARGSAVYAQFLNERGGIEADVTVTRFGPTHFRVTGGAATRRKDACWLRRCQERLGSEAIIEDKTETECVLGVMGPKARALLEDLADADLSTRAFPFATSQVINVAGFDLRATRLSFVGEAGWELYLEWACAKPLYRALVETGRALGLAHLGHLAMDSCRVEKGYRHWGHDIGPESTPLEAGLGFAVAWQKEAEFIGRSALRQQRENGLRQRLMMFAVQDAHPLLLHDEPVYRDGERVSCTTSGARGFRTGLSICMAYVPCEATDTLASLCRHTYEVGIAGERFRLRPLERPPYDPEGKRLRA